MSEWIGVFSRLTERKAGKDMTMKSLKSRQDELVKIVDANSEKFDSLWSKGILLTQFIGEANAVKYKTEADNSP